MLREAREKAGLTLTTAAEHAGCSLSHLSAIELGQKRPSVPLALRLAELYGETLDTLGLEMHRCSCAPDCEMLTFGEYAPRHELHLIASRARQEEAEALQRYKRRYKMLGTPELAEQLGVNESLLTLWVRDGLLPARRYPGAWSSESRRPLVFGKAEVATAAELATNGDERRAAAVRESWRGRPRKPRSVIRKPCVRPGCPHLAMFHRRGEPTWRKGYCSSECSAKHRRSPERRYTDEANLEGNVRAFYPGKARRKFLRGLNGARVGKLGGAPEKSLSSEQISEILRLTHKGWGREQIAKTIGVSERMVRKARAEAKRTGFDPAS